MSRIRKQVEPHVRLTQNAVGLCSCVVFRDNSTIIRERMYLKSKQNDRLGIHFIALYRQLYIISVASEIAECFEISIRFA